MDSLINYLNINGAAFQALFTAALVLITLIYVVFTYWLVKESKNNRGSAFLPVLIVINLKSFEKDGETICTFNLKNIGQAPALLINIEFSVKEDGRIPCGQHYIEHLSVGEETDLIKIERQLDANKHKFVDVDILYNDINYDNITIHFPIVMSKGSNTFIFTNSYEVKRIKNKYQFWKDKAIFFPSREFLDEIMGGDKVEYNKLLKRHTFSRLKKAFPTFYYLINLIKR